MTITARYPSRCATCGQAIAAGESIEWSKGNPTRHTTCPARPAVTADPYARTAALSTARRRFTCRICGDHRDTTIPGECDDCGA